MSRGWWVGLLALGAALPAAAQTGRYACVVNGQMISSPTPCTSTQPPGGTTLRQYGSTAPMPSARTMPMTSRPISDAEDHVRFLGAECASISEGLRTGPSRGVTHGALSDLRKEYQRKCSEEDREARTRAQEERRRDTEQRRAERSAQAQIQSQGVRQSAQCDEMLRSLTSKRRRLDTLTPGERDDLARFETVYEQRCRR